MCVRACARTFVCVCEGGREEEREGGREGGREGERPKVWHVYQHHINVLGWQLLRRMVLLNDLYKMTVSNGCFKWLYKVAV